MKLLWTTAILTLIMASTAMAQRGGLRGGFDIYDPTDPLNRYDRVNQTERLPLQIHQEFSRRSLDNTIMLKKEIRMQHPGVNPRELQLVAVKLVAKSKRGRGEATLVVGQDASYPETIGGNPLDYDYGGPRTFDRVHISNPSLDSQGRWQIDLRGKIKVKKVVVIVKKKARVQNVSIRMYGQTFRGFNVLKLKKELRMQNPMLDLQNAKLKKVTLIAKSKRGMGEATLVVGGQAGYPELINGNPRMFDSHRPRSYDQVTLRNPSLDSHGKWQVELQGKIKIHEIIVTLKTKGNSNTLPLPPRRGGRRGL